MRALLKLAGGVVAGLAVGYVIAVLLAPEEGAEAHGPIQLSAAAVRDAPRQVQARVQAALAEGQRAAAATRADLAASAAGRPSVPGPL
jgi:hypothetical protein